MKTIYLDMDGVLVDFVGAALNLYEVPKTERENVQGWDGIPATISAYLGEEVADADLWKTIAAQGKDFWDAIQWLPWGKEVYSLCVQTAPTVLMTTPTGGWSAHGKMDWINREICAAGLNPADGPTRFAITNCKHHFARETACLIDDSQSNYQKYVDHGGHALLFPAPWNAYGASPTKDEAIERVRAFLEEWADA